MEGFSPLLSANRKLPGVRPLRRTWVALAVAGLLLSCAPELFGAQRKRAPQSFGVIAGSVFEESGRSLPGAKVKVTPLAEETSKAETRVLTGTSDSRGEFAIRVPAGSMRYNVRVEARGFEPEEKQVQMEWDQRVELFFRLKAFQGAEERK